MCVHTAVCHDITSTPPLNDDFLARVLEDLVDAGRDAVDAVRRVVACARRWALNCRELEAHLLWMHGCSVLTAAATHSLEVVHSIAHATLLALRWTVAALLVLGATAV